MALRTVLIGILALMASRPGAVAALAAQGQVYLVEGTTGPLLVPVTRRGIEVQLLHVFASRAEAERHMKKTSGKKVIIDPVSDFLTSTLPWASERGHIIVIEPIPGAGMVDVAPADLRTRLQAAA